MAKVKVFKEGDRVRLLDTEKVRETIKGSRRLQRALRCRRELTVVQTIFLHGNVYVSVRDQKRRVELALPYDHVEDADALDAQKAMDSTLDDDLH